MADCRVAIIDYGMGNLFSVKRACERVGLTPLVSSDKSEIIDVDALILPGVGAFGNAMANLKKLDLIGPILDFIASGRPFMGICLGMQLLMSESREFGTHKGLDIIKGSVVRFEVSENGGLRNKVPQVNWNRIFVPDGEAAWNNPNLKNISNGEFMYFVHSYYAIPEEKEVVLSVSDYGGVRYCSAVCRQNVFATQFHPEKSAGRGLEIYRNWASAIVDSIGGAHSV